MTGIPQAGTTRLATVPGPVKRRLMPLHAELPRIQHAPCLAAFPSMAHASDGAAPRRATTAFPQPTAEAASATALTQPAPGEAAARPGPAPAAGPPGPRATP